MNKLYYRYVSAEALEGFSRYKYSCKDTNPLSVYVLHPFWNKIVLICPMWIAPNLLTLVGFMCCIASFLLPAIYDYNFTSSTLETPLIPSWAWILASFLLFMSHTLDGIDGKQARRTGSSSPLGELFDHGCDSWAATFITCTFFNIFGVNTEEGYSISPLSMYLLIWMSFLCFHVSHWEKYNTGVMYLPWGYDIAMVSGALMLFVSGIAGVDIFKVKVMDISPATVFGVMLFSGAVFFTIPVAIMNIVQSYRDGSGKMKPFLEAMRPMYPLAILAFLCWTWVLLSPNDIVTADMRCYFYMTGTIYSTICCRLIVAQMSGIRCEGINWMLIPLAAAVGISLLIPGLPVSGELSLLYILTALVTVAHLHYAVCLLIQMCDHLKIQCFKISPRQSNGGLSGGDSNSGDRERLLSDMQDQTTDPVEVVISGSAKRHFANLPNGGISGGSALLVSDEDEEVATVHV